MWLDLNDEPGICYKHSQLHQAIAATNCSVFCNVFTQDNSLCCYLNNVTLQTLQACVVGKLLLATKPTKSRCHGQTGHLRGFSTITHHSSQQTHFQPIVFFLRAHTAVPLLLVRHSAMLLKIQAAAKSRIRIEPQPSVFRNTS